MLRRADSSTIVDALRAAGIAVHRAGVRGVYVTADVPDAEAAAAREEMERGGLAFVKTVLPDPKFTIPNEHQRVCMSRATFAERADHAA